ncbi:MAG: DUF167 family protein [Cycloclasticus sp.]|nr:DUF167 family protein [Cycloclasticus sp.]
MSAAYYSWSGEELVFNVFLQPRASKNAWIGRHDNAIKIALTSPPVDGEANKQLIQFLAKRFSVKKSSISIISGAHTRHKRVSVCGASHLAEEFFK